MHAADVLDVSWHEQKSDLRLSPSLVDTENTEHATADCSVCTAALVSAGLLRILFAGRKGDTVLFLGPAGAGKTTMYLQLRDGTLHNGTVASMAENVSRCMLIHEKVRDFSNAALSGLHLAAIAVRQRVAACAQPAWAELQHRWQQCR